MAVSTAEVWFYHLERTGLDQALPELLEKTLQKGWKAMVRARDTARLAHLDSVLWTYRDDSFLPHGADDEPAADRQPILLTTGFANMNQANALFLVDGADVGELVGYERCVVVFDGADEAQLATARAQYRTVKASGAPVSYWKQQARGWEKQG